MGFINYKTLILRSYQLAMEDYGQIFFQFRFTNP